MEHSEVSIERAMLTVFKDRLKYNALKYHAVFYSADHGYEYNYETSKVRPFTSVMWLDVGNGEFDPFISYINMKCEDLIKQIETSGYEDSDNSVNIGSYDNGYIIIDFNFIDDIITSDSEYTINAGFMTGDLLRSYEELHKYIKKSYDKNKSNFKKAMIQD